MTAPDKFEAFKTVIWTIALAGGIALLSAVLSSVAVIVRELQQIAFADHMQDIILRRSVDLDLEYYEKRPLLRRVAPSTAGRLFAACGDSPSSRGNRSECGIPSGSCSAPDRTCIGQ